MYALLQGAAERATPSHGPVTLIGGETVGENIIDAEAKEGMLLFFGFYFVCESLVMWCRLFAVSPERDIAKCAETGRRAQEVSRNHLY